MRRASTVNKQTQFALGFNLQIGQIDRFRKQFNRNNGVVNKYAE